MVVRISFYSNTKKFFQKTIDNVKSFLSGGGGVAYQKLPKNSPLCNPLPIQVKIEEPEKLNRKEMIKSSSQKVNHGENILGNPMEHVEKNLGPGNRVLSNKNGKAKNHQICDKRSYLVSEKLKELALIDKSNEEHALDIEEVLHYYSRLTCPAYRDIVDKFFVDMYSEFFRSSILRSST